MRQSVMMVVYAVGELPGGVGDSAQVERAGACGVHWEVGGDRRHLSLYAQLQRRAADLRRVRQQRRLPTEKDLGENS